jgi:hypothetical protein
LEPEKKSGANVEKTQFHHHLKNLLCSQHFYSVYAISSSLLQTRR